MMRTLFASVIVFVLMASTNMAASANDDYLVPIIVGGKTFTLTISVGETNVSVRVSDPSVSLGKLTKAERSSPAIENLLEEPSARTPEAASANGNANLRGGPGTSYPVVGKVKEGETLVVQARNQAGDWLQLTNNAWIAAFLVDNAPSATDLTVAAEIPLVPAPTAAPVADSAVESTTDASASIVPIGTEIEGGGWRFKVSAVHKRKAVYFYDESYIAMGRYLIVVIDATNLQSGTDYFDRNIDPWVTDMAGNEYSTRGTASGYARWQYGGLSSLYADVNPGNFVRIAFAVDLPDSTGRVLLSTAVGKWIDLGDFAAMQSEDN